MVKVESRWINDQKPLISQQTKWLLQAVYWSFYFILTIGLYATLEDESFWEIVLWTVLTGGSALAIFYSYFYFFIPNYLGKNNLYFVLITIVFVVLYPPVKYFIDEQLGLSSLSTLQLDFSQEDENPSITLQEIGRRFFMLLWNIPLALFARFTVDWFKNQRLKAIMATQQLKSELALLRNQVNPHFLFNVLNNIDAMVYPHSQEASDAIVKLSSIMRYMLYESDTEWVDISREVHYLQSFVDLQRMRFKASEHISLEESVDDPGLKIAPMILIPFVENAFKHANHVQDRLSISIKLTEKDHTVVLEVLNSFDPTLRSEKDQTGGIGLNNVKKRLNLIYTNRHVLDVVEAENEYRVKLTLESGTK
ncbi:MAG: histidine kinase [Bacteroidota bacterium]